MLGPAEAQACMAHVVDRLPEQCEGRKVNAVHSMHGRKCPRMEALVLGAS